MGERFGELSSLVKAYKVHQRLEWLGKKIKSWICSIPHDMTSRLLKRRISCAKPSARLLRTIFRIALFESLVGGILLLFSGSNLEFGGRRGKVCHSCKTEREEFERTLSTDAVNCPRVRGCTLYLSLIGTLSSSQAGAVYCRTLQLCNNNGSALQRPLLLRSRVGCKAGST